MLINSLSRFTIQLFADYEKEDLVFEDFDKLFEMQ